MQRDYSFIASIALSLRKRSNFTPSICTLTWRRSSPLKTTQFNAVQLSNQLGDVATNEKYPSNPTDGKPQQKESFFTESALTENDGLLENAELFSKEDAPESGDNSGDIEPGQVQDSLLEGTLVSDSSDKNFLDALSKGWDDLSQFDPDNIPPEPEEQANPESTEGPLDTDLEGQSESENKVVAQEEKDSTKKATKKRGRKPKKQTQSASTATSDITPKGGKRTKKVSKQKEPVIDPQELSEGENELRSTPRWYFVQVKPSCENNVATSIRNLTQSIDGDDIVDVLVPMTKTLKLSKGGSSTEKDERYFPGYILVLMRMDRISYGHLKRIPHVQGFMGDPNDSSMNKDQPFRPPIPVSDLEMRTIFEKINGIDVRARQAKTGFQLNDTIQVLSGSMEGTKGQVVEVKPDLDAVNCKLMLFGRETTVELKLSQIALYSEEDARRDERLERSGNDSNRNIRSEGRKRRVDSSFGKAGKVDYSSANVSSAADDLGQILLDDADDSWDPLAGIEGKGKVRRASGHGGYQNDSMVDETETDEAAMDDDEGFQDIAIMEGDNVNSGGDRQNKFISAEKREGDSGHLFKGIDVETQDDRDDPDGLINSDAELDEFLRMENANDVWASERTSNGNKQFQDKSSKAEGNRAKLGDKKTSGNMEIDPELKMVLDEIDQELEQEESRNESKNRAVSATTRNQFSGDFSKDEFDIDKESESDWLDSMEFPFDIDAAEAEVPPGMEDALKDLKSKKGEGKSKNIGKEVNPDEGDVLLSEFEKHFSADLGDVGEEIITVEGSEDIAQFDPALLETPKSDEDIIEEFRAQKKRKRNTFRTGRQGRKRTPANGKQ